LGEFDYIEDFVRHIRASLSVGEPDLSGPWFVRPGKGSLFLDEEDARLWASVLDRVMKEFGKDEDISRKAMQDLLVDVLFESLDMQDEVVNDAAFEARLSEAVKGFGKKIKTPPSTYTCYVPVRGLSSDGLPKRLGSVRIINMNIRRLRALLPPSAQDGNARASRRRFLMDLENEGLFSQTMAEVEVLARDVKAAEHLARRQTREVVDVLNFFADLIPYNNGWLYLAGEAGRETATSVVVAADGALHLPSSIQGPLAPMSLKELQTSKPLRPLYRRVRELLQSDPRPQMTETLVTSLRWAGRAHTEPVREQAFLDYAIALEALMVPDQDAELSYRLQVRSAHVLANELAQREMIVKWLAALYGRRSKIVHSGSFEVSEQDLARMRQVTKRCIGRTLTHRSLRQLERRDDYVTWLNKMVLR